MGRGGGEEGRVRSHSSWMTAYIVPTDLLLRKRKWTKYLQSLKNTHLYTYKMVRYNIKKNNKYPEKHIKTKEWKYRKKCNIHTSPIRKSNMHIVWNPEGEEKGEKRQKAIQISKN